MDKLGLGRKMEQAVMAHDQADGWDCWQPKRSATFGPGTDIWGHFDYIAIKPWHPVKCVQVKRHRAKEAETAFNAIKSFAELYHAPIAPFVVLWARERRTERISFKAWEYTLIGWVNAGEWTE